MSTTTTYTQIQLQESEHFPHNRDILVHFNISPINCILSSYVLFERLMFFLFFYTYIHLVFIHGLLLTSSGQRRYNIAKHLLLD